VNSGIFYHTVFLSIAAAWLSVSTALCEPAASLSISGTKLDFVWVPLDAPEGAKRVEIGDFSGKHPKEKKRNESIYAPFEQNGKRGYYLGKTEVTEEQWASVTGQGSRSKLPVTGKTYTEIQGFLDKLNGMMRESGGIPRTPDGAEGIVKLPTEAEWEYAVRGAEGPSYKADDPYGGDLERYELFYLPGSAGNSKEVGSLPPNPLGLHDMLGNVRELMDGSYSVGGVAGGGFLLKGGSYLSERAELRSSGRAEQQRLGKDGKPSRRPDAGLRLCLSAEIFTSLASTVPEAKDDEKTPTPLRDVREGDPSPPDASQSARQKETKDMLAQFLRDLNSLEQQMVSPRASEVTSPEVALPLEAEPPDPPGPDSTGFRKAAERGDADAQNNLGASYANGNGVPQNYALAVKWYHKAAKQGNSMAQKNLGVCYFNGQGVLQDFVEAYKWYSVAAANGEGSKAAKYRDDAGRYLTPSQLARAQAEASQLFDQLRRGR
jgi:hypothetical protein